VWTLCFLFGFQIYFDFSAYSYIAIGTARLFGVVLPENFNFPYLSSNPREFWRRWHITLGSWIRDYLYLPLSKRMSPNTSQGGLSDVLRGRIHFFPLILTWLLMGLWHGADWKFVLWGVYHGLVVLFYRAIMLMMEKLSIKIHSVVGVFVTLPIIMIGWLPFRANSSTQALEMFSRIFDPSAYANLSLRENTYLVAFCLLILVFSAETVYKMCENIPKSSNFLLPILKAAVYSLGWIIVFIFLEGQKSFIYFQF
jgi:D-alanyl-lipoteichoic acid acyltransferase DltB (MBOAT superfamily)